MKKYLNLPVLSFVLALIVLIGISFYYLSQNKDNILTPDETPQNMVDLGGGVSAIIEEIPREDTSSVPSLKRPLPKDIDRVSVEKIEKVISDIEKMPSEASNWINLGLLRRSIGDFEGAKEAWEYASKLRPNDPVILGNLGILYGYNIGEKEKALNYFKQAIEADKLYEYPYIQLFEFYRDVIMDTNKARSVIEEGLKNIPSSEWLKSILSENVKAL